MIQYKLIQVEFENESVNVEVAAEPATTDSLDAQQIEQVTAAASACCVASCSSCIPTMMYYDTD